MLTPRCLSSTGPCKELCDLCIKTHNDYVEREIRRKTDDAISWLDAMGYEVVSPEERAK